MATSTDNLNSKDDDARYECNICFETAKDAVISMCGHLFCWPCIHRWMETKGTNSASCPVCKSVIDKDRLIPIYGRGPGEQTDPRDTVPPRPQGQREEGHNAEHENGFFNPFDMGGGGGLNISFGAFPLFGFGPAFTFQTGGPQQFRRGAQPGGRGNPQDTQRQRMARLMLTLALLFIIMIIVS